MNWKKLDPAYQVYFGKHDSLTIDGSLEEIYKVFEEEEKREFKTFKKFFRYSQEQLCNCNWRPGI